MTNQNGSDILVEIDGDLIATQSDVTFDESTAAIEFFSKDTRARGVEAGHYQCSISLDALYCPTCLVQQALKSALRLGGKVTVNRIENGVVLESCQAIVASMSEAAPDAAPVTVAITFEVDGEWVAGS